MIVGRTGYAEGGERPDERRQALDPVPGRSGSSALALSLWIVSVITFTVTRLIGNPVDLLLGPRYTQEQFEAAVERLGSTCRSGASISTTSATY